MKKLILIYDILVEVILNLYINKIIKPYSKNLLKIKNFFHDITYFCSPKSNLFWNRLFYIERNTEVLARTKLSSWQIIQ